MVGNRVLAAVLMAGALAAAIAGVFLLAGLGVALLALGVSLCALSLWIGWE